MEYQKVVLYYPNNWKRFIGDVAPPSEKKFNWFLCSRHYKDTKTGMFVSEIDGGTKFYEESTGNTLVANKAILLVAEGNEVPSVNQIKDYGYQGFAKLEKCNLSSKAADEFVVCKEAEFYFLPGVLKKSQKEKVCPIIVFSKRNNKCIRSKIHDFPTPEEIDEVLDSYKCSTVCRVLYDYIYLYLSKL